MPNTDCECGHADHNHPRAPYSAFPCSWPACGCLDYTCAIPDDQSAIDITRILQR